MADQHLFIHKVQTVVSMSQMLEEEGPGEFCSPEQPISSCMGKIVPSITYPFTEHSNPKKVRSFGCLNSSAIEQFVSPPISHSGAALDGASDEVLSDTDSASAVSSEGQQVPPSTAGHADRSVSITEKVLVKEWDRRFDQGLFRYDVRDCETRCTEGAYAFIAQLNEGRATKKRATEFRVDKVNQPFDSGKFNFQKAALKEVLFQFTAGAVHHTHYHSRLACGPSPNLVLINVSPIEYGHMLLVPRVNDCIPQKVDQTSMLFALQFAREVHNPFFRLGYNSLGAFGTINHLHFQGYFLQQPYPVERAPTAPVVGLPGKIRGVTVERLLHYPVEGWVFSGADNVDSLSSVVGAVCMRLQVLDIPHNILICDMGGRVMLWPQCFAKKQAMGEVPSDLLDMGVNPAAFEIAGHMVLKRREDYERLTQDVAWKLLKCVSLTEEDMSMLEAKLFDL